MSVTSFVLRLPGWYRVLLVASVLWVTGTLISGLEGGLRGFNNDFWVGFLILGIVPIILLWGTIWIIHGFWIGHGFKKRRKYIYAANYPNLPYADDLIKYYEVNIVKIARILKWKKADIPRNVALYFEEGEKNEGASYNREERKIIYKYQKGKRLIKDKGRLIHEAAHVVQDYSFRLVRRDALWLWAEGIADFCRLKLDPEFRTGTISPCRPEEGYDKTAYFLEWLSNDHPLIVAKLNRLIHDKGLSLKSHDHVFLELLQTRFNDLVRKCIDDNREKRGMV